MSHMNKYCEQRSPALCVTTLSMGASNGPRSNGHPYPGHVASLGLQRMRLLSGTQEEMHGFSYTSKSRMSTRGCGRGYTPETGNGTWGVSPRP